MKNVADIYPLTPTQAGILYHTLEASSGEMYFQQIRCKLRGALDTDKFIRAWDEVTSHHPALRTIFLWEGVDEPVQVVRETVNIPWDMFDWRNADQDEEEGLAELCREYRLRSFDLRKAPIMRMVLVQHSDERYTFIWNFHHILTDGWSTHLVLYEVFERYEAMVRGEPYQPAAVRPFKDYIDWLKRQDNTAAELYWRGKLAGFTTCTRLNVEKPLKTGQIDHHEAVVSVSEETTNTLKNLARKHHLTLNTFVQGAWSLLLSRYSGENDVVFGVTLSGRPPDLRAVEQMVGMFINTLPIRVQVEEDTPMLLWLKQLQTQQLDIRQYEYSSLAEVQRWSDIEPWQPLFESILVFENYPMDTVHERSLRLDDIQYREQSNYPLAVLVLPANQIRLLIIYDQSQYDPDTIQRMLSHLQTLLTAMAGNPDQKVRDLPLLTPEEYHLLIHEWNRKDSSLGQVHWVHEQISEVARANPAKVAVAADGETLTFSELDALSNKLAHHIIGRGVKPGSPVGLFLDRSPAMLVGILGVLKAGCAYVPLDPTYPASRIDYVLQDMQAPAVVTQHHLALRLNLPAEKLVVLDKHWSQIRDEPRSAPDIKVDQSNLAYLIYTSGSTGIPKGVMVTHNNLFSSNAARRVYYQKPVERFLLLSSFAFDSSVAGIFWTLTDGGTLILPEAGDERDIDRLAALIAEQRVTHTLALPSLYRLLLDFAPVGALDTLKTIIVAGEACPPELWANHISKIPSAALYNEYGPTEATVWATVYQVTGDPKHNPVPIGRAIANTILYVVDPCFRPVPIGVPGELVIGGLGVVPGYWNKPDLTAERFFPNPFDEGWLYRSGDRVRWLPDGNLEFLGRADNQVKIRGYRVELGEIENALRQNAEVRDAVVIYKKGQLLAYLVAASELGSNQGRTAIVSSDLAMRLPDYMQPAAWVWLHDLPRMPNGKINRNGLPEPAAIENQRAESYVESETETQKKIQAIWCDLLGSRNISVKDDFFSLGGHSLLLIQLVSRLRQVFGFPIPLNVIFDTRTIAGQAERIDTLRWNREGTGQSANTSFRQDREEMEI